MGLYRPIDYHRWAPHLDFASWDNYPPDDRSAARMALTHDLMRGLKDGQPFWLMEQTPTTTACRDVNPVKRPGVMRLWSWQAVAHGADAVLFFQMRASRGACEKYHGAVIDHAGRDPTPGSSGRSPLWAPSWPRSATPLGARTPARSRCCSTGTAGGRVEISDGPSRHVRYSRRSCLRTTARRGRPRVDVDVVPVTADLSAYDVVLAPVLHMVKGDLARTARRASPPRGGTVRDRRSCPGGSTRTTTRS